MKKPSTADMVSVIIPCYEAADDVGDAIQSVLQQTREDCVQEVIVVDDGSTDESEKVVRRWEAKDDRVQYIYQDNQGPSAARNRGVEEAHGDYVAFLDADDLWLQEKLEHQINFLEEHPDVLMVCSDYYLKDEDRRRHIQTHHYDFRREDNLEVLFSYGRGILTSTVIMKRSIFFELGGFDTSLLKGQDTDLWLRVTAEHLIHHLSRPLVEKRSRVGSVGEDKRAKIKYQRQITDKLAAAYPRRLEPLRDQRNATLAKTLSHHLLRNGELGEARQWALEAIRCNPSLVDGYILLVISILPVTPDYMAMLLNMLGQTKRAATRYFQHLSIPKIEP